ncbi:flagellar hook-associated protein FlgK [Oceanobacillus neutriphilus]|uniref:Flagellar hook-associated protein 1 n=1 Tax=Oceanobacillus neutriphilus TaxID=531815 RepID=A0ABQ2NNH4_9BACI|nr:flagellar hook-associated protein FlgK [Oceanobacillus neutriphilus]GGP06954.1 flagellar hook-associated protein 1 [Oceanobacillus neutriphilus]
MSTFRGLEMSRQALSTQQSALYTTGHNISNANTPGYTRQRVNMQAMNGYPTPGMNSPHMPGQLGTGVEVGSVQRIRNQFLDTQFRAENASVGYWSERTAALSRMENLLNEPSDSGIEAAMSDFWSALQEAGANPTNNGARAVVLKRGESLADTFNHLSKSMNTIRKDLQTETENTIDKANAMIDQLDSLNSQIKKLEIHGYNANDLYDKRDNILDELSEIVNIEVKYDSSHIPSGKQGDGVATVNIILGNGNSVELVNGTDGTTKKIDKPVYTEIDGVEVIESINVGGIDIKTSKGIIQSHVHAFGYVEGDDTEVKGDYPEMLGKLDELAYTIVNSLNEVYKEGNPDASFFEELSDSKGAAGKMTVALEDYKDIIVSTDENAKNGDLAKKMADIFTSPNEGLGGVSVNGYLESIIGDVGVDTSHAITMLDSTATLQHQVSNQRQSISAVSLDEEMTNMIKFQHAYNAAARGMTAMDELIDTVINRMGLVGR